MARIEGGAKVESLPLIGPLIDLWTKLSHHAAREFALNFLFALSTQYKNWFELTWKEQNRCNFGFKSLEQFILLEAYCIIVSIMSDDNSVEQTMEQIIENLQEEVRVLPEQSKVTNQKARDLENFVDELDERLHD